MLIRKVRCDFCQVEVDDKDSVGWKEIISQNKHLCISCESILRDVFTRIPYNPNIQDLSAGPELVDYQDGQPLYRKRPL